MWPNLQETADLVTFTKEILTGKLHFFIKCDLPETLQKICVFTIFPQHEIRWNFGILCDTWKCEIGGTDSRKRGPEGTILE